MCFVYVGRCSPWPFVVYSKAGLNLFKLKYNLLIKVRLASFAHARLHVFAEYSSDAMDATEAGAVQSTRATSRSS